jgi:hypothetical protein
MVTPAEIGLGARIVGWFKSWFSGIWKRRVSLEARVTALENALKTMAPEACPYCGERAMRLKEQLALMGNQGSQ